MPKVITWSSIELLHNVVTTLTHYSNLAPAEGGLPLPKVSYRGKVKLHGTNCAVQTHAEGLVTQSRETILTPESDLKGFAKWVRSHDAYFRSLPHGLVVFGEWCGPGVEKGMAISAVPDKMFCVFGIQDSNGRIVYDPAEIVALLTTEAPMPTNMHILPWADGVEFTMDYADPTSLQAGADYLNTVVAAVEKEDPWVKATFGVSGLGEGVVLYPVGTFDHELCRLMFKAKGEKHRTAATKEAVQVAPEVVATISDFVTLMVTDARLEQGLAVTCEGVRDPKRTRDFLAWVEKDVQKESKAELEASDLTWSQVEKAVQIRARSWFLQR